MAVPLFDTSRRGGRCATSSARPLGGCSTPSATSSAPRCSAFEQEFAAYCGGRTPIGVANGTDAITIALRAMGVGPGDEVVVPSFTFYAIAEAIPPTGAARSSATSTPTPSA